jgi:hypothetical protein
MMVEKIGGFGRASLGKVKHTQVVGFHPDGKMSRALDAPCAFDLLGHALICF